MNNEPQPQHFAFRAHGRHVVTVLSFNSDKIITASDDTNIEIHDANTGELRTTLSGHTGGVWCFWHEDDTLVSGSTDCSIRVWNISTGKCLHTFRGHTSTVRILIVLKPEQTGAETWGSPTPLVMSGSRDSTIRVWQLPGHGDPEFHQTESSIIDDNPYALRTLRGHNNSIRDIAAHGDTVVSGSYDCTVRVWRVSTGEQLQCLRGHTQKVYSVVLDHERERCISGSMDNSIKVWSIENGACLLTLNGHVSLVGLLSLGYGFLVSGGADGRLCIWDAATGQHLNTVRHSGAITAFQHDRQKIISGADRELKMWNVTNGQLICNLLTDLSGVWQVRFNGKRCVAAVQRNNLSYIEVIELDSIA